MQDRFWNEANLVILQIRTLRWHTRSSQGHEVGQTNVQTSHWALSSAKDRTEKVNYWKIFEAGMGTHSGQQITRGKNRGSLEELLQGRRFFDHGRCKSGVATADKWLLQQTENRRPDMLKGWQGWHHFLRSIPDPINHNQDFKLLH